MRLVPACNSEGGLRRLGRFAESVCCTLWAPRRPGENSWRNVMPLYRLCLARLSHMRDGTASTTEKVLQQKCSRAAWLAVLSILLDCAAPPIHVLFFRHRAEHRSDLRHFRLPMSILTSYHSKPPPFQHLCAMQFVAPRWIHAKKR